MHEMALCRNVVDVVVEEATKAHAVSVRSVSMTVGEVRDIVDDIFVSMFDWLARGTVAQDAKVTITRVPLQVTCQECGNTYHLNVYDTKTWTCPECGKRNYKLKSGMEFYISQIEIVRPELYSEASQAVSTGSSAYAGAVSTQTVQA